MMTVYMEILSDFATTVFRTMYNPEQIKICDTKPTYQEEQEEQEPLEKDDLFKSVGDADKKQKINAGRFTGGPQGPIRLLLMPQVLNCRDKCMKFYKQGGMSEDEFMSRHPPIEKPEDKIKLAAATAAAKNNGKSSSKSSSSSKSKSAGKKKKMKNVMDQLEKITEELAELKKTKQK